MIDRTKVGGFHRLFERQVERTPDALAVVAGETRQTYRQLNERANRLGHHLRALGIGAESLVGICLERSELMIVGVLGILKAGGAYVPLDPHYPRERLRLVVADSGARIVLTQQHLEAVVPAGVERVLCLDADWPRIEQERSTNPDSPVNGANLAYVVYTSGSTGMPKGVGIEHHSTASLMHWAHHEFGPDVLARVLASSSLCFDMSVFEIFAPLCSGGAVVLVEHVLQLGTGPVAEPITLISTVPSAIAELATLGWVPEATRSVLLAGEALTRPIVDLVFARTGIEKIWNLYGLSEDTSYTTSEVIVRDFSGPVTIGRAIHDRETYVLDDQLQPVEPGEPGELYVGGGGLGRGYLGRPALTAARFIPNPFSPVPGARLYRTGDRVRQRADGRLEFLGRIDHQVKLRGYRIELGEIEATLTAHESVTASAVVLADVRGEQRLIAFVSSEQAAPVSASDLQRHLASRLPKWMVPSVIVPISTMPRTANGKIDRQALQALTETAPQVSDPRLSDFGRHRAQGAPASLPSIE